MTDTLLSTDPLAPVPKPALLAKLRWIGTLVAQLGLPVVAGLVAATQFTTQGSFDFTKAIFSDLDVYMLAAGRLLTGESLFAQHQGELPWLYHPMAALIFTPLLLVGRAGQWYLWTAINSVLIFYVTRQFGVSGWWTSFVATAAILLMWPITHSFHLGQIGVLVMALVVAGSQGLSGTSKPGSDPQVGRARRVSGAHARPSIWNTVRDGLGIGAATVVKLTPAFFAAVDFFSGRWRAAVAAFGAFVGISAIGFWWRAKDSSDFWVSLISPIRQIGELARVGNQSVVGAWLRTFGPDSYQSGLIAALIFGVFGLAVAVAAARRGQRDLALCVAGFASLSAAPLSWAHQFVWVLPLTLVAVLGVGLSTRLRLSSLAVVVWLCAGLYDRLSAGAFLTFAREPFAVLIANFTLIVVLAWFVVVLLEKPADAG